ncbi:MAG TPA: hypothetical protein VD735_04400 [Candidatus Saccharimonadales bacterium]|nr:hypothetical protein [Candidatus Saccharimonadales bacterium]
MSADTLARFVSSIMNIKATTALGGAAAGIFGTAGMGDPAVQDLKALTADFAATYRSDPAGEATARLGNEVAAGIQTLQVMSVLSLGECDELLAQLHNLIGPSGDIS